MFYLIFHLLFRITPSNINAIQKESFHKFIRTGNLDRCWEDLKDDVFTQQTYQDYMVYCHDQLSPSVFHMTSTSTTDARSTTSNSQVFKIRNVECSITTCPFAGCTFKSSLINFEGTNNNFIANGNTISNCYDGSGSSSANIMYVDSKSTTIQENTITFESVDKACRTFRIINRESTTISGNQITNANINEGSNEKGIGIYITDSGSGNIVHITYNTFTTCGKTGSLYVAFLKVPKFEFNFNKITSASSLTSCGCVTSESSSEIVYMGNIFVNSVLFKVDPDNWRSAGIDQDVCISGQEKVTIENNTFDGIRGNNQGRCLYMKLNNPSEMIFRENSFINSPSRSFLVKIVFVQLISEMTFESCKFIKNTLNNQWNNVFNSCNQLIIQNKIEKINNNECSLPFTLNLINCNFEENTSPMKGGGFHYGNSGLGSNTIIKLIGCSFIKNTATQDGGAIAIQSYQGFLIDNCTFKENTSSQKGGAIYLESDTYCHDSRTPSGTKEDNCIIRDCIFQGNTGNEAHCISVQTIPNIQILTSTFTNCGTNNYVININNTNVKAEIQNCTFEYTNEQASASAVSTISTDIVFIGNSFKKCNLNTILLQGTQQITHFELIDNLFYYCYRGAIIRTDGNQLIQSPIIRGNTFEDVHLTQIPSIYLKTSSDSLTFDNNTFKSFAMNADQGGIGLEIKRNSGQINFVFEDCYFIGNSNNNNYQCGGLRIDYYQNSGSCSLMMSRCLFESNRNNVGAGLGVCTTAGVTIEDTTFKSNSGDKGSAIYVNPDYGNPSKSEIIIRNCRFEHNPSTSKASIYSESGKSKTFRIENCIFEEEQGCLYFNNIQDNSLIIESTNFIKTSAKPSIYISQDNVMQQLTISQCTFDDCSSPGNKCLQINTKAPTFTFMNNIIQNCKLSGYNNYCGTINLNNAIKTFELTNITFLNNTSNSLTGGGSSIKIEGTSKIVFNDCKFISNHAFQDSAAQSTGPSFNGCGGGIQLFSCDKLNIDVTFTGCLFKKNEAQNHGGAISIEKFDTTSGHEGFLIENCQFIENIATQKGGSIYIGTETSCPNVAETKEENHASIVNCLFERTSGNDGHCIFVQSVSSADIMIDQCNFTDCGSNNYAIKIPINDLKVFIKNNTFEYSNEQSSAAALSTTSTRISIIGNTFKKSNSNTIHLQGTTDTNTFELIENLFYYCYRGTIIRVEETAKVQTLTIKGNTFDDVHLSDASLFLPLSSNSITFDNNTFKSFVMNSEIGGTCIRYYKPGYPQMETVFDSCYFIGNTNNNVQHQGGGLRIDYYQNNGKTSLRLTKCTFENNVNQMGAGLSLCINSPANIEECSFIGNNGHNGSSIFISPDYGTNTNSLITISRCYFGHNQGSAKPTITIKQGQTKDILIESCIFEEDQGGIYVQNLGNKQLTIESTQFIKLNTHSSIIIDQTAAIQKVTINQCTFDSCSSPGNKCLQISTFTTSFSFTDNIIKNCQSSGCNNYCATINLNNKITSFELTNISFINNTSNSLYGGGSSLIILGVQSIVFNNCHFTNNCAYQDQSQSRPTSSSEQYYNGDGGAIQIGYWCQTNNVDVSFTGCDFSGNKAERHGGAISIQTLKTVNINGCSFENNVANSNFELTSKINLKETNFENHFHKKIDGRGGSIYINPSYSYSKDGLNCPTTTNTAMQSFAVSTSTFSKNNAFDGYAMYIEGDESGTSFQINSNTFSDNYNESNFIVSPNEIYGAVIASEIQLQEDTIISSNTWNYANTQLHVKEVQFVDHYGHTLSQVFTFSNAFTKSDYFPSNSFSKSDVFSISSHFSSSNKFSDSKQFSKSNPFSGTKMFSSSHAFTFTEYFSLTKDFSKSEIFSDSKEFSKSLSFSKSKQFSDSKDFSSSQKFSETNEFSLTSQFSKSDIFSDSKEFSKSLSFSKSKQFSDSKDFSSSQQFSETNQFSLTSQFSKSDMFSESKDFSESLSFSSSIQFSKSKDFSSSQQFSETNEFSLTSQFSKSDMFSESKDFSESLQFSESLPFSRSKQFSDSKDFSLSQQFSETNEFSLTSQFSKSDMFSESKDFSESLSFSSSIQFSKSKDFSSSQKFSETNEFSLTSQFSKSDMFSESKDFSESLQFSSSIQFSKSKDFSSSQHFSETNEFSLTSKFSKSDKFSESKDFSESLSFSSSIQFSKSEYFSSSQKFSETNEFSLTSQFSKSYMFSDSKDFSESLPFSKSKDFSLTQHFSLSKEFSLTDQFSKTGIFSDSTAFSKSLFFSPSQHFSNSKMFSSSAPFSYTNKFSLTDLFSYSYLFSNSESFSISTKFSESFIFSSSVAFSRTEKFSLTEDFTISKKFSLSTEFTKSTHFSISSEFSKSNFFSNTKDFTKSTYFSSSKKFTATDHFSLSNDFSKSEEFSFSFPFTPSASLIPNNPSCIVENEYGNITFTDRCDYSDFEGQNITVHIVRSNFTDFIEDKDGAAVHIKNCGIKCNGTEFIDCASTSGGGGGIYINNTIEHENNVDLINLVFIRCKSYYGGAVFIQSNYELNRILIQSCHFRSNEVYRKRQNSGVFFGGSSVYLMSNDAEIINNTFFGNKGQGGCFKIFSPSNNLVQLEDKIKSSIKIDACEFEQFDAIYYESKGKNSGDVEINDCNFKGKLVKGSYYIDGNVNNLNSPKFHIRSCKFEHRINESINSALIKEISSIEKIDVLPIIDSENSKNIMNNNLLCSFAILLIALTACLILIGQYRRHLTYDNDDEENYYKDDLDDQFISNQI